MQTGSGEWIWRSSMNPPFTRLNSFFDNNPRGFGLLQRDRNFDHLMPDDADLVDLRLYLRDNQGSAVSETWLYQWQTGS